MNDPLRTNLNRCRCIQWVDGAPCCRERSKPTVGSDIDRLVREAGCFTLTNLNGDRLFFFPRKGIPSHLAAYLNGDRLEKLRDFLITQARVGPTKI
jgi:hypothetical protein